MTAEEAVPAPAMRGLLRFFGLTGATMGDGDDRDATPAPAPTTIGPGITLKGELRGSGTLVMLGHFEGDITLDGVVHVGPEARVEANVSAQAIVIAGVVRGNLSADTRVEILPTGSLTGTVKSGSFSAADGATVKSELWVERSTPSAEPRA
jgi:cytoskeletal protein CcmA (bactofilin family)